MTTTAPAKSRIGDREKFEAAHARHLADKPPERNAVMPTNPTTTSISVGHLRDLGHSGRCDQPGCKAPITHVIAQATKPMCVCGGGCDHGNAAIFCYCADHVHGHPIAAREHVKEQCWRDITWRVLLAVYPRPVALRAT
jgi:hypothetical protein